MKVAIKKIGASCGKHRFNTSSLIGYPWETLVSVRRSCVEETGELGDRCFNFKPPLLPLSQDLQPTHRCSLVLLTEPVLYWI